MDSVLKGLPKVNISEQTSSEQTSSEQTSSEQTSSELSSSEQRWFIKAFVIKSPTDEEASFQNDEKHIKNYVQYLNTDLTVAQIMQKDLTKEKLEKEFTKTIPDAVDRGNYTHILLIFSAHGYVGKIECSDGKNFDWLSKIKQLNENNEIFCKIQKMIIIDTCQTLDKYKHNIVNKDGTFRLSNYDSLKENKYFAKCLKLRNLFYGFSTIEGYLSPMDKSGSPYLRCLFYQLLANAYDQSNKEIEINLSHSHIETNAMVSKYFYYEDDKIIYKEMPCYFSTLVQPLIIRYKKMDPRPTRVNLQEEFNMKAFFEPIEEHED